jgi:hypothetical protein
MRQRSEIGRKSPCEIEGGIGDRPVKPFGASSISGASSIGAGGISGGVSSVICDEGEDDGAAVDASVGAADSLDWLGRRGSSAYCSCSCAHTTSGVAAEPARHTPKHTRHSDLPMRYPRPVLRGLIELSFPTTEMTAGANVLRSLELGKKYVRSCAHRFRCARDVHRRVCHAEVLRSILLDRARCFGVPQHDILCASARLHEMSFTRFEVAWQCVRRYILARAISLGRY